jgi:hypothetical protein
MINNANLLAIQFSNIIPGLVDESDPFGGCSRGESEPVASHFWSQTNRFVG